MARIPLHNLIEAILKIEGVTDPKEIEAILSDDERLKEIVDKVNKIQDTE